MSNQGVQQVIQTVEKDAEIVGADILAFLKTAGADVVATWDALLAAAKMGNFAPVMVDAAILLKDAVAAEQQLVADVTAAVPDAIKAFLASTATLDVTVTAPVLGPTTLIAFRGTRQQLLDGLGASTIKQI